ncbi:MAG: hypothetical protein AB1597_03980 [Chloroflexota bacterium]
MRGWVPARRFLVRRTIVLAVTLMVFIQAFYHFATGGLPSFITEAATGAVLGLCLWLSNGNATGRQTWRLIMERCLLITIAVVLLVAGIYHFTHEGYYSGVLQPLAAALLGFTVYLSFAT